MCFYLHVNEAAVAPVRSPGRDGVSVLLVNAVHSGHGDLFDVFLLYSHVGAFDGH